MVVGSILKGAQKARLWPFPEPPYKGFTVDGLKKDILFFPILTLCDISNAWHNPECGVYAHRGYAGGNSLQQRCLGVSSKYANDYTRRLIDDKINSLSDKLCGLSIENFK
jgi:hypothetical protein